MSMMIRREVARAAKAVPVISYVNEEVKPVTKQEESHEEVNEEADSISRDEVMSMPYFGLKALALRHGIDPEGKKTAKLREEIVEKLSL